MMLLLNKSTQMVNLGNESLNIHIAIAKIQVGTIVIISIIKSN